MSNGLQRALLLATALAIGGCSGVDERPREDAGVDSDVDSAADADGSDGGLERDGDVETGPAPPCVDEGVEARCEDREIAGEILTFCRVPAGCFVMGSPLTECHRNINEVPHPVEMTVEYEVLSTEVPQRVWASVGFENPSIFFAGRPDAPLDSASWYEALAFANALSRLDGLSPCYELTGCDGDPGEHMRCDEVSVLGGESVLECEGYRLPTEAEWERAARAGTTTATSAGDICECRDAPEYDFECHVLDPIAWIMPNCMSARCPHDVGAKLPNGYGLYDMIGNVSEWVWDRYGQYPTARVVNPVGPSTGDRRIHRGGASAYTSVTWQVWLRSAARRSIPPGSSNPDVGFRIVRSLP